MSSSTCQTPSFFDRYGRAILAITAIIGAVLAIWGFVYTTVSNSQAYYDRVAMLSNRADTDEKQIQNLQDITIRTNEYVKILGRQLGVNVAAKYRQEQAANGNFEP